MKSILAIMLLISSFYRTNSNVSFEQKHTNLAILEGMQATPIEMLCDIEEDSDAQPGADSQEMRDLVQKHMDLENALDLEGVLATLVDNPIYEVHLTNNFNGVNSVKLRLEGKENIRPFYREHFNSFFPLIEKAVPISTHWCADKARFEFDLYLKPPYNPNRPYRLVVVLTKKDSLLIGENFHTELELAQAMTGTAFNMFKRF